MRRRGSRSAHVSDVYALERPCPHLPPSRRHPAPGSDGLDSIGGRFAVLVGVRAGWYWGPCGERAAQVRELRDRGYLRQGQAVPPNHRRSTRGSPGRAQRATHRAVRAPGAGHRAGLPTRPGLPGLRRRSCPPRHRPGPRSTAQPRPAPTRCPVNRAAVGWALSPLDFRAHAVTEHDNHPIGVLIAHCGHLLPMVVVIDTAPPGAPCPACTRAVDPAPAPPRGSTP